MKTCLLLSGLPRFVRDTFANINNTLVLPNSADVFIHTWFDETQDPELASFILENYKPKRWIFEKQRPFANKHLQMDRMMATWAWSYQRNKFVEMLYSSWYSILMSNLLKEQYRLENDFGYDAVIRARFDIVYDKPIVCANYNMNELHISRRTDLPPEMLNDQFAFASNEIMNLYCNGFGLMDHISNYKNTKDGVFCGETLVYEMVTKFGLKHNILNEMNTRTIGK
jgi:hypothetical protein